MNRSLQTGTPGYMTFNGLTMQMEEDWSIAMDFSWSDIKTHLREVIDRGLVNVMAKVTVNPIAISGSFAAQAAAFFPFGAMKRGAFLFTNTDVPLVIQTVDGQQITFTAAAITKPPTVTFSPDKPLYSGMELTCLIGNAAALADADCFLDVTSASYTEPTFSPASAIRDEYTLSYTDPNGASVFDAIEVGEGGIVLTPTVNLVERKKGTLTYNMMFNSETAELGFRPENVSAEAFAETLAATEISGLRLGSQASALGRLLKVRGSAAGKPLLVLPSAYPTQPGGMKFGTESITDDVKMTANRIGSSTAAAATTSGNATVTVAGGTGGLSAGMSVSGTGIAGGTTISSIGTETTFVLSAAATATSSPTVVLTFTGQHALYNLRARS